LVEFAPKFAVDLIDLIEQNRRNSELFRGFLRMKIDGRYGEVGMQKCQVIFDRALKARDLLYYWAVRELVISCTDLAKQLEMTQPGVGTAMHTGHIFEVFYP
jgi:hypothetical protein